MTINIYKIIGAFNGTDNKTAQEQLAEIVRETAFTHYAYGFENPNRDIDWQFYTGQVPALMLAYKMGIRQGLAYLKANP